MTLNDALTILPVIFLVAWAMLVLVADLWIPRNRKVWTAILAALGIVAAMVLTLRQANAPQTGFGGMIEVDGFAVFLNIIFLFSGLAGTAIAFDFLKRMDIHRGEYYVLMIFSIVGAMLLAYAGDLILIFLGIELLSIPLYVLAGFAHPQVASEESALKYFLLGTFASTFVLFGIALLYGATGITALRGIVDAVKAGSPAPYTNMMLLTGAGFLIGGLGFKVAAVPFHAWTPDVYHGAPAPVTGFMSVVAKAAGFAALMRVLFIALPSQSETLTPILWVLAVLTMVVGNVVAIAQNNLKRMLAYSSIANAGYLLMALVTYGNDAVRADSLASMLFYLLAYALASLGVWAVITMMERQELKGTDFIDLAGLGKRSPLVAAALAVLMLSFTGVPLTLGFWGKFYLFRTAIQGGFIWLAVIGLLTSLVSAYYYLRVVVMMFFREGEPDLKYNFWGGMVLFFSTLCILVLSFFPGTMFGLASQALLLIK
ncbi:MAG TPA: NADH-quinone oxidoreductase subunit N [Anaerolineaceae bacterium]|nr:NADH-quinone oxidoreductase subunit N [Anaerolineaceae bacterium]